MRKLNIFNKKSTGGGKLSTLLAAFILLLIVTSSTSARAAVSYDFVSGDLRYKINEDGKTVTLVRYDGDRPSGELIIPATVTNGDKEYSVTAIGDNLHKPHLCNNSRERNNCRSVCVYKLRKPHLRNNPRGRNIYRI